MEKIGKAQDQVAMPSQAEIRADTSMKHEETTINDISDRNQEARFGFTNIGSSGSYAPAKIDLGGLLLGAIIGVGSILIIPKLLYVLSGTNQVFRTAMQGTAIQEAVEAGHSGKNCSYSYPHCGFSLETMLSLLSNIITAISTANARAASSTTSPLL